MIKKILLVALVIVLYLTVFDLFVAGPVGVNPKTYACLGKEFPSMQYLMMKLPNKTFGFRYPFEFRYAIKNNNMDDAVYCIGKSVLRIR